MVGYGLSRLQYAAELAVQLTDMLEPATPRDAQAETPATLSPEALNALKAAVAQALRNLGVDARAGVPTGAAHARVSSTLEELADAIVRARGTVPTEVLHDAGLTDAVERTLRDAAHDALAQRDAKIDTTTATKTTAYNAALITGRLVHEARAMLAAARQSRKLNAGVPEVRARLLATRKTKRATAKTPAVTQGTHDAQTPR